MTRYDESDLRRAAAAGIQAPSMHNSQPWAFRLRDGAIEVLADPSRQLAVADGGGGWAMRLACGSATFNARLALAWSGTPAEVRLLPDPEQPEVIARLTATRHRPPTYAERDLHAAIERRSSHRDPFWPDPVPAEIRVRLIEAARTEYAWLDLLVGMTALTGFSEIAHSADRVLRRDTRYQSELVTWTDTDSAQDGIPVVAAATVGEPQDLIPQRNFGNRHRPAGRDYEPEPLVGILGTAGDRRLDQVTAGQALQHVLLRATDAGLASSMISQPIEVPAARDQLRRSLGRSGFPQIAFRIGYGRSGHPSPRRDVDAVIR
ncbi:Acg family FMN-binding oxidoreductase [Actinoplanes sp. GCM10030250]|uniref:Acg family FMN-binding oxidoreductase n=1 Tax=Actinoplanes sp. GCM10030250 TaxID=3273376 RepID=UPI0036196E83